MKTIKYMGGLSSVQAPWDPNIVVPRDTPVEAEDADALVGQSGSPWVYVGEVEFKGAAVKGGTIEFTPSPKLDITIPAAPPAEGE